MNYLPSETQSDFNLNAAQSAGMRTRIKQAIKWYPRTSWVHRMSVGFGSVQ